jgi:hypothetical protein
MRIHTLEREQLLDGTPEEVFPYAVGYGVAGELAHRLFVARDVRSIFDYRATVTRVGQR